MTGMKKIMILGAGQYLVPLIKSARDRGLYVIVVSPGTYAGMELADMVIDCDIGDEERILFFAEKEKVDGIASDEMDLPLLSMARATESLGLPGNPYDVVKAFTDKGLTRERCRELGIRTVEYATVSDLKSCVAFMEKLNSPAIIKPVDSGASKGVTMIEDPGDLERCFTETMSYSRKGEVIIERFIRGKEFEVDGIVLDGKYETLMIADMTKFKRSNRFSCSSILFPSVEDEVKLQRLREYDREIVQGLGMIQGLTHNEYILDEETDEFYLIEAAARGGGRHISTAIAKMNAGVDTSKFLIDAALGEAESIPEIRRNLCHCGYVAFCLPEGTIESIKGLRRVTSYPFVFMTTMDELEPGMRTAEVKDKRQRHLIYLSADSREKLDEYISIIRSELEITVITDEGKRGIIWE